MAGQGPPIGIIAGAGSLPIEGARSILGRGGSVHVVMVDGLADPALKAYPHTLVNWAQVGRTMAALKSAGVHDVVMLGATGRPSFSDARPDMGFLKALPAVLRLLNAGGDDAVLRGLVGLFERNGLNIIGVREVVPELLIGAGVLTPIGPSARDTADIATGFDLIATLGRFDIGQAAVVTDGRIEAIEAAEGTDRMLKRVAEARLSAGSPERRGVLVKLPKPGQDLRVDLPTIGPNTARNVGEAGLAGIAVMAGQVLAAERSEMIAIAKERGLFISGIERGQRAPRLAKLSIGDVVPLGAVALPAAARNDVTRATGILSALTAFETGSAVVISERRVIAIGAGEPPSDVFARALSLRGRNRRRRGVAAIGPAQAIGKDCLVAADNAKLGGVVAADQSFGAMDQNEAIRLADKLGLFIAMSRSLSHGEEQVGTNEAVRSMVEPRALRIFLAAGEHSGDALGAKLMSALKKQYTGPIRFSGVGGEEMCHEGFTSLFPIEDVAVMGPLSILPRLPRIVRRVYQTVDAALAFEPDAVVVIDSPEFTHPIARRIRKRAPNIPIIDYVSPSVWAWRPGRAKKMRGYIDRVLALLPFEPAAYVRLGGPPCTYVGHPLIEKLDEIQNADAAALAARLGLAPDRPVLLVLPGSRTSEVGRLIDIFGETIVRVSAAIGPMEVIIPAVRHLRELIVARTAGWTPRPHIVDGADDKYAAMRLARAALAASGTVTLELALAKTPSVVAYKVDNISGKLMFLIKVPSVVLANLVLGTNVYPELLQDNCTPEKLAAALLPLLGDTEARTAQLEGLARTPDKLRLAASSPSAAAAEVVLAIAAAQAAGKSRRGGPT